MKDLEFTFEQSSWEATIANLRRGSSLSALRFLALTETESDETAEDALAELEDKGITLDITALPRDPEAGQMEKRLALEERLVREGGLPGALEAGDPLRIYLEEVAATPVVLLEPEVLAKRCLAGDERAQAMLVNSCLSRVIAVAGEYTGRGVLLLDLIQEGSLGLWQGILRYQGGDFTEQADWWTRQYMAKAVTLQARAGGIGQRLRKGVADYQAADKRLLTELGRNPTLEEIAGELGILPEEAAIFAETLASARRMERVKKEPEPQEEDQAVEDTAYFRSRQRIAELLADLEDTDAEILRLRFGLEGGLPLSPEQVGAKLGIPAGDVLNRETAVLAKLRQREET